MPGGVNYRPSAQVSVTIWSIVSWRTWLALFPHVMTGRHMVAGHVVLWEARVWPAIKLGAGSRVPSSAGSSGRQTSCRSDATCICEFSDVLNARLFVNSTSFGDVELFSKVFREIVKVIVDLR